MTQPLGVFLERGCGADLLSESLYIQSRAYESSSLDAGVII
jgi:hypothetical protein